MGFLAADDVSTEPSATSKHATTTASSTAGTSIHVDPLQQTVDMSKDLRAVFGVVGEGVVRLLAIISDDVVYDLNQLCFCKHSVSDL